MEELGFWELVHGTSAGCASIVAFESLREVLTGPALLVLYLGITWGLYHLHHLHLRRVKARKLVALIPENTDGQ